MLNRFISNHLSPILNSRYLRWTLSLILGLMILTIGLIFCLNPWAGLILLVVAVLGLVILSLTINHLNLHAHRRLSDLSYQILRSERQSLLRLPFGIMILNAHRTIEWVNPYLRRYFHRPGLLGQNFDEAFPQLASLVDRYRNSSRGHSITWQHRNFILRVAATQHLFYLTDVTRTARLKQWDRHHHLAIGKAFLDNYREVTSSMSDSATSNLRNYVVNQLTKWTRQLGVYFKPLDADHFLLIAYTTALVKAERRKFSILARIRRNTSRRYFPVTLSIGIAYGDDNLVRLADQAQSNLDLALSRGGDQVVVRSRFHSAKFYGGTANPTEKRTRVRARVTSQALQALMRGADQIFVQGHSHPDLDVLGACLGIHQLARAQNKKCWIVLNHEPHHSDVAGLLKLIQREPTVADALVTPGQALKLATNDSLLVLVDHSKLTISASLALCRRLKYRTVVIDHHRLSGNFPHRPLLEYLEPSASSACELITEMLVYQVHDRSIGRLTATAMLGGIVTDTQSFSLRTGPRTFDAASYLRSAGADADLINHLRQESANSYLDRNHLISRVTFTGPGRHLAIVTGEDHRRYDPVTAAQAADSLLNVAGVKASFVATRRPDDEIGISARSDGRVNVQLIMEKLGGGGHLSSGAAQIKGQSIAKVKTLILKALYEVNLREIPTSESGHPQQLK